MLVLCRKLGEKVLIGDDVVVTVVDIDRNKIRLGITAPRDVPICRSELLPLAPALGGPPPAPPAGAVRPPSFGGVPEAERGGEAPAALAGDTEAGGPPMT